MDNKQARKTGRILLVLGCVLLIIGRIWLGLAVVSVGLVCLGILGRCPHCGRSLFTLPSNASVCPRCRKPL
ncbi:MAG: hypothetical protein HUJ67_00720 [Ruminiclostridium sp.]|nr:hypothetical protein [Ruminiclostridium sp.]